MSYEKRKRRGRELSTIEDTRRRNHGTPVQQAVVLPRGRRLVKGIWSRHRPDFRWVGRGPGPSPRKTRQVLVTQGGVTYAHRKLDRVADDA